MQSWLADNFDLLVMLLGIIALAFTYAWWRTRRRAFAVAAGTAGGFIGLVFLLVYLLPLVLGESDSHQIERKVRAMAAAVKAGNLDEAFRHISSQFRFRGLDRPAFRQKAAEATHRHDVEDIVVWEFEHGEISRRKKEAKVRFMVKVKGNWRGSEAAGYRCDADFVLDPDGQWRLKGFQIFNPFVESDQPLRIPGF
jgi:hypothetical protein